jgi:hypothetical protein
MTSDPFSGTHKVVILRYNTCGAQRGSNWTRRGARKEAGSAACIQTSSLHWCVIESDVTLSSNSNEFLVRVVASEKGRRGIQSTGSFAPPKWSQEQNILITTGIYKWIGVSAMCPFRTNRFSSLLTADQNYMTDLEKYSSPLETQVIKNRYF